MSMCYGGVATPYLAGCGADYVPVCHDGAGLEQEPNGMTRLA